MQTVSATTLLSVPFTRSLVRWLATLGGPGLILVGLLDSSVIPVPGSLDVVTMILTARERALWPYYALMATIGSVWGGYLTYRLAGSEGERKLAPRISERTMKKVEAVFSKWGFGAIAIPALFPPPMPMVPFVIAAGAARYSRKNFLIAFSLGRSTRFVILAYLSAHYGRSIIRSIAAHGRSFLWLGLGLLLLAGVISIALHIRERSTHPRGAVSPQRHSGL